MGSAATLEEVRQRNKPNKSICHFIATFKELCEGSLADDTPYNQLSGMKLIIKSQIENMDKANHNDCIQCIQQARKQQQELIGKHPKQANKYLFSTSTGQPRAGMVALQDPITQEIDSEPDKIKNIVHAFFSKSLHAVNPKTSQCLPEQTPRHYPWDDKANRGTPDPFTLESNITRSEKEGSSERQWLHSSIIDQAAFHNCISSLKNNKSPGPEGVVNKVL
jgi:hypothetical protein